MRQTAPDWVGSTPDRAAVQLQLTRILASSHFRNSKRCQALLRYVVDASLSADSKVLVKERCVGSAVFGRAAAYDTGQDPVVRNAAIDVRKRLAQYYLEPEHEAELRIELPTGSYHCTFVGPASPATVTAGETSNATSGAVPPARPAQPESTTRFPRSGTWLIALAAGLLAATGAWLWSAHRSPATELEAFWAPLFPDDKSIQIWVGQPTRLFRFTGPRTEELNRLLGGRNVRPREAEVVSVGSKELTWVAPEFLYLRDALASLRVASWIQSKGKRYQIGAAANANYSQVRQAPMVTIGAFNNTWSMRVTSELRFVFERRAADGEAFNCIIDRRNPKKLAWRVAQPVSPTLTEDFAIVTRVFDPDTERAVISAAGIEAFGTLSASEFVTQSEYLGRALMEAPPDWRKMNVQFVLGTKVIDGTPGPARVLAAHYW